MHLIKTKAELIELLFQELDESKPRQKVDPSFLLRVGGFCCGLSYGGFFGEAPYLSDTLAIHHHDRDPTWCGEKLVAFAQSFASESCFDPTRVWTEAHLIDLMLAALDSDDLQVQVDPTSGRHYLHCTPTFAARRRVQVRVRLGRAGGTPPVTVSPLPT